MHGAAQRRQLRDLVADDEQLDVLELAGPQLVEGLDQPHEVLVRLDVADVEDEPVIELIPLAHAGDGVGWRRHREVRVDGVVDDDDLLGRDVEEVEDVPLGRVGHRQNAVRSVRRRPHLRARIGIGHAVGQILRKHQVNAVVDRHDRAAADRGRQHVVRRVIEIRPLAPQHPRHVNLLADGVVRRGFEHGSEVRTELSRDAEVGLAAEQDVLGVVIDARELAQEIADVSADAEVVELPRVDRDSHVACDSTWLLGVGRWHVGRWATHACMT